METLNYSVTPEPGNPFVYHLYCKEKNLHLEVIKMFEDPREATFNFDFWYKNDEGGTVYKADYEAFAKSKGITRADNMRAAIWFLTRYFNYKELNYGFPSDGNFSTGSYYPVLGNHLKKYVFQLKKA